MTHEHLERLEREESTRVNFDNLENEQDAWNKRHERVNRASRSLPPELTSPRSLYICERYNKDKVCEHLQKKSLQMYLNEMLGHEERVMEVLKSHALLPRQPMLNDKLYCTLENEEELQLLTKTALQTFQYQGIWLGTKTEKLAAYIKFTEQEARRVPLLLSLHKEWEQLCTMIVSDNIDKSMLIENNRNEDDLRSSSSSEIEQSSTTETDTKETCTTMISNNDDNESLRDEHEITRIYYDNTVTDMAEPTDTYKSYKRKDAITSTNTFSANITHTSDTQDVNTSNCITNYDDIATWKSILPSSKITCASSPLLNNMENVSAKPIISQVEDEHGFYYYCANASWIRREKKEEQQQQQQQQQHQQAALPKYIKLVVFLILMI